jgi:hypothetical protein
MVSNETGQRWLQAARTERKVGKGYPKWSPIAPELPVYLDDVVMDDGARLKVE